MVYTMEKINEQNGKLAKTIVRAVITDWTGKILFESSDYNEALDVYFTFSDEDDVELESYDKNGINHGVFYWLNSWQQK